MRLEEHISQLLFQHDCVIVPNFGAFITNSVNVTMDHETNTFIPPRKEVSFNSSLLKNDGVLINEIIEKDSISFDNAQTFLNETVYFWQEHLKNGKILNLNNIGSLQLNESGKIDFKPNNAQNYFIAAYGLTNLQANFILEENEVNTSDKHMSKLLITASLIPIIIGGFLYFNTPQPVQKFVTEQWSGLVLPILNQKQTKEELTTIQYDIYNSPQTISEPSLVEYQIAEIATKVDTIDSPKKVEITVVKETKLNENEKEITAIVKEKPAKKEIVKTEIKKEDKKSDNKTKEIPVVKNINQNKKYQVIAASLKREEDANRLIEELKKQGYKDAGISYVKGKYYYVTYSSFSDLDQAQKYMNEVNKKSPGTWVRTQN